METPVGFDVKQFNSTTNHSLQNEHTVESKLYKTVSTKAFMKVCIYLEEDHNLTVFQTSR